MDDDIERDPTAQIIKPKFRQDQESNTVLGKKIKVKLKNREANQTTVDVD